jgi:hypothetical protein
MQPPVWIAGPRSHPRRSVGPERGSDDTRCAVRLSQSWAYTMRRDSNSRAPARALPTCQSKLTLLLSLPTSQLPTCGPHPSIRSVDQFSSWILVSSSRCRRAKSSACRCSSETLIVATNFTSDRVDRSCLAMPACARSRRIDARSFNSSRSAIASVIVLPPSSSFLVFVRFTCCTSRRKSVAAATYSMSSAVGSSVGSSPSCTLAFAINRLRN